MSLLNQLLPGVSPLDLFPEAKTAIAAAISQSEQMFVSANLEKFLPFLRTNPGEAAVQAFVEAWQAYEIAQAQK